jgi:hypothetical protein
MQSFQDFSIDDLPWKERAVLRTLLCVTIAITPVVLTAYYAGVLVRKLCGNK